jgi:hypothetical protein
MTPGWPLILTGPMPRRVQPGAASVFVACSRPSTVRLSLYDGAAPGPTRLVHMHADHTVPLGSSLQAAQADRHGEAVALPYPRIRRSRGSSWAPRQVRC